MTDMAPTIVAKSDQWNAEDFVTGPQTFTIREVKIKQGEQPVNIFLNGSDKAYRPCKSMCRVLVHAWGRDAKNYVGKSLTLFTDPTVKWAGVEIGGIRISHLSHISGEMQVPLTVTRQSKKLFSVSPLQVTNQAAPVDLEAQARKEAELGRENFTEYWKRLSKQQQVSLKPIGTELGEIMDKADGVRPDEPPMREPGEDS